MSGKTLYRTVWAVDSVRAACVDTHNASDCGIGSIFSVVCTCGAVLTVQIFSAVWSRCCQSVRSFVGFVSWGAEAASEGASFLCGQICEPRSQESVRLPSKRPDNCPLVIGVPGKRSRLCPTTLQTEFYALTLFAVFKVVETFSIWGAQSGELTFPVKVPSKRLKTCFLVEWRCQKTFELSFPVQWVPSKRPICCPRLLSSLGSVRVLSH